MSNKTLAVIVAFLLTLIIPNLFGERKTISGINDNRNNDTTKKEMQKKMKIKIWSDVMCPFCYDIGLTNGDVKEALTNTVFQRKVESDGAEAYRLGAKGVPFFIIDRKYAIAGAQSGTEMLKVLQPAYMQWK